MKSVFILILFISTSIFCTAQSIPKKYFDQFWKPIDGARGAYYYRVAKKVNDGYSVQDYYISGKLQMDATCSEIEPKLIQFGNATFYYESGAIQQEGAFKDGESTGLHKYYRKNGTIQKEIIHGTGESKYSAYYNEEGNNVVKNGEGLIVEKQGDVTQNYEIKDSILLVSYTTYSNSTDTLYGRVEQPAVYNGGEKKIMQDLQTNLIYPQSARRQGIQGRVYVQFRVTKEGKIDKLQILKGLNDDCNNAAYKAVVGLKNWTPAMHKGKPVDVLFVQPVTFKITW